ncbi:N-alpha-acetyltransferase 40 [Tritrichomonas foetus]|uniref:N-alpha-acetyltransferase 40 n=1 Tax=Tritrichomonas foetus TaxID=1144522 RepID=A0A1J4KDB8_9EUKA|nr:N-alpha-acetyltransferase 40 [Tritrichomonas foetus]|eukprot:OHT08978.1 N-alpha-acetyltransferase 40 [Tritrichomonas foetus]
MSARVKAKKAAIRAETELINQKRAQIAECEKLEDPLSLVPMFKKFNKNGLNVDVSALNKCPEEFEEWAFQLIEKNMKAIYEETWGWNPDSKEAELLDESARFLFAYNSENQPVGFVHYRFEFDNLETKSFIYDIQLEEEFQGKGLGKFLLQAVEFITLKLKLDCVMTTLFKENVKGRGFFKHMHYQVHKTSPALMDPENEHEYDHEILYKPLVKKT